MDAPLHLLPQWLMPDDQPGDWYQWTLVASGHAMLGIAAFVPARAAFGARMAWVCIITVYAMVEALQLVVGGLIIDGLTDALFVVSGMTLANEAVKWQGRGFGLSLTFLTLAVIVGIWVRL